METNNLALTLSEEQKEKIVAIITQRKAHSKSAMSEYKRIWELCLKNYWGYSPKKDPASWRNNIFVPVSFEIVETIVPMIMTAVFSVRPVIGIVPQKKEFEENAKWMEKLVEWQVSQRQTKFYTKFLNFIKDAVIYGIAVMKIFPYFVNGRYYYPHFDNVELFDFFIQPKATSIDTAEYCGVEYRKTFQHILRTYPLTAEEKEILRKTTTARTSERWSRYDTSPDPTVLEPQITEYYGYLPLTEDEGEVQQEYFATVLNDKILVQLVPNPFDGRRPFVYVNLIPYSNEFFSPGYLEIMADLQKEINKRRNQSLDHLDLQVRGMWKVLKNAGVDLSQIVARPDGIVYLEDFGSVERFRFDDASINLPAEEQRLLDNIQRLTGVYPYTQGQVPPRQETAAGIISLQQAAGVRFKVLIELVNDMAVEAIGELLGYYNQKFITSVEITEILGRGDYKHFSITNKDIVGSFDYTASGSSEEGIGNSQIRRLNYLKLFNILLSLPPQLQTPVGEVVHLDHYELVKKLLEFFDITNIEKILVKQQLLQQQMAEQAEPINAQGVVPEEELEEEPTAGELALQAIAEPPQAMGVVPERKVRPALPDVVSLAKAIGAKGLQ